MDPYDKSQTEPVWQRVLGQQPAAPAFRPTPAPQIGNVWTTQEFWVQAQAEAGFGRQSLELSRRTNRIQQEALIRISRQAMERSACLRGMARPEQRDRFFPGSGQPAAARREPVEQSLFRLLTQARQFEGIYAASQNHPIYGPVFSQFRQEAVQAIRTLLLLLGQLGR